jgi:hypothetical protein
MLSGGTAGVISIEGLKETLDLIRSIEIGDSCILDGTGNPASTLSPSLSLPPVPLLLFLDPSFSSGINPPIALASIGPLINPLPLPFLGLALGEAGSNVKARLKRPRPVLVSSSA